MADKFFWKLTNELRLAKITWTEDGARVRNGERTTERVERTLAWEGKIVLLYLYSFAARDMPCWPTIAKIAEECSLSERTAQRAIADLDAAGLIEKTQRSNMRGSERAREFANFPALKNGFSNVYVITPQGLALLAPPKRERPKLRRVQ